MDVLFVTLILVVIVALGASTFMLREAAIGPVIGGPKGYAGDFYPAMEAWLDTPGGVVVGPVIASNDIGARALIAHLVSLSAGRFVRIDLDFDSGLTAWIEEQQLHRVGTVTTMVRGTLKVAAEGPRLFALATQALG